MARGCGGSRLRPKGRGSFPAVVPGLNSGPALHDDPALFVHANAFLAQGFAAFNGGHR